MALFVVGDLFIVYILSINVHNVRLLEAVVVVDVVVVVVNAIVMPLLVVVLFMLLMFNCGQ